MAPPIKKTTKQAQPPMPGLSKLTKAEKRLILHPPTPETWVCTRMRMTEGAKTECGMTNSKGQQKCWLCTAPKPRRPKLLWPAYLKACQKAGIEPKEASP